MNPSPPKKEAALPHAAPIQNDDAETLSQTPATCNKKSLPPGFAWERGSIVPVDLPPVENVPLTTGQILMRTIAHACAWSDGNPVRWQAFQICVGYDGRPISEAAESLRVTPRLLQMRVAECRSWLSELRAELEATP